MSYVVKYKTNKGEEEMKKRRVAKLIAGLMKVDPSQITYIRLGESGALVRRESTVRQWTDFLYTGAVNILGTVR